MISLLSQKLSKFNLFLKTKAPKQEATYEICIYILNSNMQDSIVLLYTMSMKCLGEALYLHVGVWGLWTAWMCFEWNDSWDSVMPCDAPCGRCSRTAVFFS
jgi:hypothetical protein